jgi:hypothetical protein
MNMLSVLYSSLFGTVPEENFLFMHAEKCLQKYTSEQINAIIEAQESGYDMECMEYMVRQINPDNPLTTGFKIVVAIGECTPENYPRFVNNSSNRIAVPLILIQTFLHLVKCTLKKPFYAHYVQKIAHA